MLHVLLILLKILLWLIAGILGLVLLLLLCILLCPIRYRAEASYYGGKTAHVLARLRYLIFGVRFLYDQGTGDFKTEIRVLWFRLGGKSDSGQDNPKKHKKNKKNRKKSNSRRNKQEINRKDKPENKQTAEEKIPIIELPPEHADEIPQTDSRIEIPQTGGDTDAANTELEREAGSCDADIRIQDDDHTDTAKPEPTEEIFDLDDKPDLPKEERNLFGRLRILLQKLSERLKRVAAFIQTHTPDSMAERISSKLEAKTKPLKKKLRRLKRFWNLRCTEKTRAYLKKYIPGLFRHILPRKVKGRIHYGMEEPYKTGQITGYLSLLPFMYQKGLSVEPDFEQKVFEIDLKLKGHFTLGYMLRIALNINIWRTIKAARKVMNNGGTN